MMLIQSLESLGSGMSFAIVARNSLRAFSCFAVRGVGRASCSAIHSLMSSKSLGTDIALMEVRGDEENVAFDFLVPLAAFDRALLRFRDAEAGVVSRKKL